MKHWVTGVLAHVDAGKTTLCEALMYRHGALRKMGRVDHGNTLLDTHEIEKKRGITVFSKQAVLRTDGREITLLDTPGHVDFAPEAERALQVLDSAILVINATDGVQGHTGTLWKMLEKHRVPTFVFINKTDLPDIHVDEIMRQLNRLSNNRCVNFSGDIYGDGKAENADDRLNSDIKPQLSHTVAEAAAVCSEELMEEFLSNGEVSKLAVARAVGERSLFPCYFGTALKLKGVDELFYGLCSYLQDRQYGKEFGARVFKIDEDSAGTKLVHMKITGGSLRVKTVIEGQGEAGKRWQDKPDMLRVYSGASYEAREEVYSGMIVAATGLGDAAVGDSIGADSSDRVSQITQPFLCYRVTVCEGSGANAVEVLAKLRTLERQDPTLCVQWNEKLGEINVRIMGDIQLEVLKARMKNEFELDIEFEQAGTVYKETITKNSVGIGHFEPLRHYAEVHLLLEPLPQGSGIVYDINCREEVLEKNYQSTVIAYLRQKTHLGVLCGFPLTDVKITLIAGRAHKKHTEGGDFRQAAYRAVRHALMSANSTLLEPFCTYSLQVPQQYVGKAMSDLQRMHASVGAPQACAEMQILTGEVPAATCADYQRDVMRYTHGTGSFTSAFKWYAPCHNAQDVMQNNAYDCEADTENTPDSVFCSHGAGYTVKWWDVKNHAHIEIDTVEETPQGAEENSGEVKKKRMAKNAKTYCASLELDKELLAIFERTYGPVKKDKRASMQSAKLNKGTAHSASSLKNGSSKDAAKDYTAGAKINNSAQSTTAYLLVDGYNIIHAWDDLSAIAADNLELARRKLIDILCNYRGVTQEEIIVVFDAYKVKGGEGETQNVANISVVYTKEAETADMYIEKVTHSLGKKHSVRVATSDSLEQVIILGHGALRLSARAFKKQVDDADRAIREYLSAESTYL